jgi:hypothetical protein
LSQVFKRVAPDPIEHRTVGARRQSAAAPAHFDATLVGQAMLGQAMAEPPPPGAQPDAQPAHRARPSRHTAGAPDEDDVTIVPAPRTVVTGVAAAIRDIASQRAQGLLTEQG